MHKSLHCCMDQVVDCSMTDSDSACPPHSHRCCFVLLMWLFWWLMCSCCMNTCCCGNVCFLVHRAQHKPCAASCTIINMRTQAAPPLSPQLIAAIIQAMHDCIPDLWSNIMSNADHGHHNVDHCVDQSDGAEQVHDEGNGAHNNSQQSTVPPPPPWRMDLVNTPDNRSDSTAPLSTPRKQHQPRRVKLTPKYVVRVHPPHQLYITCTLHTLLVHHLYITCTSQTLLVHCTHHTYTYITQMYIYQGGGIINH